MSAGYGGYQRFIKLHYYYYYYLEYPGTRHQPPLLFSQHNQALKTVLRRIKNTDSETNIHVLIFLQGLKLI